MNNKIYQKRMINNIIKYPSGIMIPIYGETEQYDSDAFYQCIITSKEFASKDMETDCTNDWNRGSLTPGFTKSYCQGKEETIYSRYNNDKNIEPFVIIREFNGLGVENEIEIVEEFRLLNNLYYNQSNKEYRDLINDATVILIKDKLVYVDYRYLKRYLSVKNMVMLIHVSSLYKGFIDEKSYSKTINQKDKIYTFSLRKEDSFSSIYAKILIHGFEIKDCGYWPYEKNSEEFETFIIGLKEDGKESTFTCNPDKLSNYFGSNKGAPHYLTLVFFRPEVLKKYYDNPERYSVGDGIIRCGNLWALYIDNHQDDYISAYLGDLGRDLPNLNEQRHWKNYNIALDGKLSSTKYKRDFLAQFSEPISPMFIFQNKYASINECFEDKYGWKLFLPLHADDEYNLKCLRIPLCNSQPEFDLLVLSLTKILIDSLNEKSIVGQFTSQQELTGSISKIEGWFKELTIEGYEQQIKFLRNLQQLRSCCTGHRKGKGYEKISKEFNLATGDYRKSFKNILIKSNAFLDFIKSNILDK